MKKLLAILLVLCLVLAAAACGSKEAAAPAADTKTEAAAPAAEETLKDKAAKFNRKDQFLTSAPCQQKTHKQTQDKNRQHGFSDMLHSLTPS